MKVLLLGLGISGKSALSFLEKRGDEVVVVDDTLAPKKIEDIETFDLFVPSPGIPRSHPLYKKAMQAKVPIKGEAQLALEVAQGVTIGVTGTNGKTSVVKMLEHILRCSGMEAKAVGNVGDPLTANLKAPILIVELSSFQLETLEGGLLDYGLLLNIAEDHLDRYESFEAYAKTKAHLEACVRKKMFAHVSISKSLLSEKTIFFDGDNEHGCWMICKELGVSRKVFLEGLNSFEKLDHRLEFICTVKGVDYVNDSKATNVAAVIRALEKIQGRRVILLVGGRDKGLSFAPLAEKAKLVFKLIAFGEARKKIANAVNSKVSIDQYETIEEALIAAKDVAEPGDTILLSPGCASFDAFESYKERGEVFKQLVRSLT